MSTDYSIVKAETPEQIQDCYAVRINVFVHEQNIPLDLEIDEYDPKCYHWLATAANSTQRRSRLPLGTIRLYHVPNTSIGKLGRLAVDLSARGLGLGRKLVEALEKDALTLGITFIDCHSQIDKRPFYEKLGYHVIDGNIFVEDGIDHIKMGKSLS
ncbi:hypothetical protein INT44_002094 [Umbelopsis vinacea]|uniref:N-acetyltransferase domain-containing protein n=1 Tax=Umbelopsis vinacea TaxID=44442 RepID=A0A8H7UNI4_9FUNG|nr:hypothetical protein INT44_002094 [Umbelopsis vinacea]